MVRAGQRRRGAVLAVLLPVLATTSLVVATTVLHAHELQRAAVNAELRLRAEWLAEGCANTLRAAATGALSDSVGRGPRGELAWRTLPASILPLALGTPRECRWEVRPVGVGINVNTLDEWSLRSLFARLGMSSGNATVAAASLLDWVDRDTMPRRDGGERAWYASRGQAGPRNAPVEDVRELAMVRGLEAAGDLGDALSTVDAPIDVRHASAAVLSALPGATPELVARWLDLRAREAEIPSLETLVAGLGVDAQRAIAPSLAALRARVVTEPWAWDLIVRVTDARGAGVLLRQRWVRSGTRAAVSAEWREWA